MLSKKYRLPIQFFPRTKLRTLRNSHFSVKIAQNGLAHARFGVLVSAKAAKSAAKRNELRRRVFNFLRAEGFERRRGFSYDVLVILSPSAEGLTKELFIGSLREVLGEI